MIVLLLNVHMAVLMENVSHLIDVFVMKDLVDLLAVNLQFVLMDAMKRVIVTLKQEFVIVLLDGEVLHAKLHFVQEKIHHVLDMEVVVVQVFVIVKKVGLEKIVQKLNVKLLVYTELVVLLIQTKFLES